MNATDILLWSAGSKRPLPEFPGLRDERLLDLLGIDPDEVLHLLTVHRLIQSFLWRSAAQNPAWATHYLREKASKIQMATQQRLALQFQMVQEMGSWCSSDAPALLLKGFTLYALTSDWSTLRFSNDLDICASDSEEFWGRMQSEGFMGKRHFTHEYAKASKDGITVDLHQNFPVLSYPDDLNRDEVFSSSTVSRCYQLDDHSLCETSLSYDDLLPLSTSGRNQDTYGVRVLDATAASIVLCAHLFRSFVTRTYYSKDECPIKLGELREIALLSRLSEFSQESFLHIAKVHRVTDSVNFACNLLTSYDIPHGLPCLPSIPLSVGRPFSFPENMIWGGWITEGDALSWVLPRSIPNFLSSLFRMQEGARQLTIGSSVSEQITTQTYQEEERAHFHITLNSDTPAEVLLLFGGDYQIVLRISQGELSYSCKEVFDLCLLDTFLVQEENTVTVVCIIDTSDFPSNIKHQYCLLALRKQDVVTYMGLFYGK